MPGHPRSDGVRRPGDPDGRGEDVLMAAPARCHRVDRHHPGIRRSRTSLVWVHGGSRCSERAGTDRTRRGPRPRTQLTCERGWPPSTPSPSHPFKLSLDVSNGYDLGRHWHCLAGVHRANPFNVAAATLGQAFWRLHPPFSNEDPQVRTFEPVVTGSVHTHEEALIFVGDLMPVIADTKTGKIAILVKRVLTRSGGCQ